MTFAGKTIERSAKGKLRIGIFAGTFDPVHTGHIAFALQALEAADLDEIVFLPERRPRQKPGVEHFAHRVAMLNNALQPHPQLSVLEMVDRNFSVSRTLPQLEALFAGHQLALIVGSDVVYSLPQWPYAKRMLKHLELIVGVRAEHSLPTMERLIGDWQAQPRGVTLIDSYAAAVSSSQIRQALRDDHSASGLLCSVEKYARNEWLYVSPAVVPQTT